MNKTLIFLESLEQFEALKRHSIQLDHNCIVVTTSLSVQSEFQNLGLTCRNTLDFFGPEGHECVSNAAISAVSAVRPSLLNLTNKHVVYAFERTAIFHFRCFLNYLLANIWILNRALKEIRPDRVICFSGYSRKKRIALSAGASISIGDVLTTFKLHKNCKVLNLNISVYKNNWDVVRVFGRTFGLVKVKSWVFQFFLMWYRWQVRCKNIVLAPVDTYGMSAVVDRLLRQCRASLPVYLSPGKDRIGKLKDMLRKRSFCFFFLPESVCRAEMERFDVLWGKTLDEIECAMLSRSSTFKFDGVDIAELTTEYFKRELKPILYSLNGNVEALYRILDVAAANLVVSQHAVGISYALGELCRANGLNGILISHGSHVHHDHPIANAEWSEHARTMLVTHYPYVAVQTRCAGLFLEKESGLKSEMLITGPLILGKTEGVKLATPDIRQEIFRNCADKKILLHAGTPKPWRNFRPWVYETLDEYVRNINELIFAVREIEGVYLVIRYRPTVELSTEHFLRLLEPSDCYEVCDGGSFSQLLNASDMLVSYSSTAIEEALQNKVPVLLFDPDGKYWHIPPGDCIGKSDSTISSVNYASSRRDLVRIVRLIEHSDIDISQADWDRHILAYSSYDDWIKLVWK